ncbi:proton glutamate symport protein [Desulfofundulus australicus DSM 11792]|uniref:Proton glutamate symport protein n=1 Tax=Desulfofundulus australicus DSM 11792 TaxID=1121425 RepID=A0A1M4Y127_9FIRM|nr:cation:dicarboxylase symporter family transporter [Desulfofundulus australicus]SHE99296.1 proton glutamate symport protein [Desulfofundulus australicus DSM 11792]
MAGKRRLSLGVQVLIGLALGVLLSILSKDIGVRLEPLGKAFIRLIQMVIVPLVFPLIVIGIAGMHDVKKLGRVAVKTLIYFEVVTTIAIVMGVIVARLTNVGAGAQLANVDTQALGKLAKGIDLTKFFLEIIPNNVVSAMAEGKLLPIIFFGIFFGLALVAIGDKGKPVLTLFESWTQAMFKVIEYAVSFAPIGVFGFVAFSVSKYGIQSLISLGQFVAVAYLAFLLAALVLFPLIALVFRVPYVSLLRFTWDLILLAFTTRSSEVALPLLIDRLEKFGTSRSINSFVLPTGYSFNLDGASIYASLAVVFIAHVYNLPLSMVQILTIIGILMVMTKGLAGVPSAVLVVLLATATEIGLPPEGVALLMAVDFFVDMGRTALNVIGNSLATVVIAKWENAFDHKQDVLVAQN